MGKNVNLQKVDIKPQGSYNTEAGHGKEVNLSYVSGNQGNLIPFQTSTFQYDNQRNLLREERKTGKSRQESIYTYDGFNRQKEIVNFESRVQGYFREEYGAENVQGSAYNLSSKELQNAMDKIYKVGLENAIKKSKNGKPYNGGPRMTLTVTQDGRVIISHNSSAVNKQNKKMAKTIFGDNVEFVKGGKKAKRPNMDKNLGNHAESKGIYYLEVDGKSTEGVKQFSSHYSCDLCKETQRRTGVLNYIGNASENKNKQKRIKY